MGFNIHEIADFINNETQNPKADNGNRLVGRAKSLSEIDGDYEELLTSLLENN